MVLTDFLTETRRRWLKAFKLFKRSSRKSARNKVSPALVRSPAYSGAVDARAEISLQRCPCRASPPPPHAAPRDCCDDSSYYSSFTGSRNDSLESYCGSHCDGGRSDSAYDSARSSPAQARAPVCYATVAYFNVNDGEDSCSVRTEYTLLDDADDRPDERAQNIINETIELVSTL